MPADGRKRSGKLKLLLTAVVVLVAGLTVAAFLGYRTVSEKPELLLSTLKDDANISIGQVHQTSTKDGVKEWTLDAGSARLIKARDELILEDLSVTFFLKEGEVHLTGDRGVLQTDTRNIEVSGHVVVRNADYRIETEQLYYDQEKRLLFSKVPVNIFGTSASLSADSMSVDLEANKATFAGKVKGSFGGKLNL